MFRWVANGTHRGALGDIPATGQRVQFNGMTWLKIRNGQIVEGWDRWNQAPTFAQLTEAAQKQKRG